MGGPQGAGGDFACCLCRIASPYSRQSSPTTSESHFANHRAGPRGLPQSCGRKIPSGGEGAHCMGIAAQLMRWILVDCERNRRAAKRGAGVTRLTLDEGIASPQRASGFCQSFSRSTDCIGSTADRGHTADREFPRFRALEVASCVGQEDAETIQPVLTRRSPCKQ
jgi:hypothetical protein